MRLTGILLRYERELAALPAFAEDGKRLSAGESGGEAGLYILGLDSLEALSPAEAEPFSQALCRKLLESKAKSREGAKLVYRREAALAALCEGTFPFRAGESCTLSVGQESFPARVAAIDGRAVLLTLEAVPALCRARFVEATVTRGEP